MKWFKRITEMFKAKKIEAIDDAIAKIGNNRNVSLWTGQLYGKKLKAKHAIKVDMEHSDLLSEKSLKYVDKELKKMNMGINQLTGSQSHIEIRLKRIF